MKVKKRIAVVTGTRAEYGLLKKLLIEIKKDKKLHLQILVTGSHLEKSFGYTYLELLNDGFKASAKIPLKLQKDTPEQIAKAISRGVTGFHNIFVKLKPHIVVLTGDRYEMLSAALAATMLKVPIAHIGGGERTEGAFDESIRHSITKMAQWHFVSTKEYKRRVIQLGESPRSVFQVGSLNKDVISNLKFYRKSVLEKMLGFKFKRKNILVTYHPETLSSQKNPRRSVQNLFKALNLLKDTQVIFTKSNADTYGKTVNKAIDQFVKKHRKTAIAFNSLGIHRYLSIMRVCDAVVGNSSSGIIEAPILRIPTVNIGDRQRGRLRAGSVIDCGNSFREINQVLKKALSPGFKKRAKISKAPFGTTGASVRIKNILKIVKIPKDLKKVFYDN